MKRSNIKHVLMVSAMLGLTPILAPSTASAQGGPHETANKVQLLMQAGKWDEAVGMLDKCISAYGSRLADIGWEKRFGAFYYWKGLCELNRGNPEQAATAFRECNEKFNFKENAYKNQALLGLGQAEVKLQNYAKAQEALEKFLRERDPRIDKFKPGHLYGNLAICNFMQDPPNMDKGYENLTLVAKNRNNASIPDEVIYPAFVSLVKGSIASKREKLVMDYLKEYRSTIAQEAYRSAPYRGYIIACAVDALKKGMHALAYELVTLVPENALVLSDAATAASRLGDLKGVYDTTTVLVKEGLKKLEADVKAGIGTKNDLQQPSMLLNINMNLLHGNLRSAKAGINMLLTTYPDLDPKIAEDQHFQLIKLNNKLGDIVETDAQAQVFIEKYPKSPRLEEVYQMTMMSLLNDKKFDKALEVSERVLKSAKPKTRAHEMALYVNGVSQFNLGHQQDAIKKFGKFRELYPQSLYLPSVEYLEAYANRLLGEYPKVRELLSAFLKKWGEDPKAQYFIPFVNYEMANAQYVLNNKEGYAEALKYIKSIEDKWTKHQVYPDAMITKGNVLKSMTDIPKAEEAYKIALDTATAANLDNVCAEALYQLVGITGQSQGGADPRHAEAIKYYDDYFKKYDRPDSPYRIEMAVIGMDSLETVERIDEALSRLQKLIVENARNPAKANGVEGALNSYTKKYSEKHSPEEVKEHFINFPGLNPNDVALKALLRIGLIGVLEEEIRKSKDDQGKREKAEALIKATFNELEKEFKPENLSPYILVKLGNYLREKTDQPQRAIPYYKEAMNDKNKKTDESNAALALFGLADIYSKSTDPGEINQAIDLIKEMMEAENGKTRLGGIPNKENINRGKFALLRCYMGAKDYQKAVEAANDYIESVKGGRDKPMAMLLYAQALEGVGNKNNAIVQYNVIISNYRGNVQLAGPAIRRIRDLLWERNQPGDINKRSDRYMAMRVEERWVQGLKAAFEKMTVEDRNVYREIAEQYEKDRNSSEIIREQEELDARAKGR